MNEYISYRQATINYLKNGRGFSDETINHFLNNTKTDFNRNDVFVHIINIPYFNKMIEEEYYHSSDW